MGCFAGNLLNSLMGSGEEDDGAEEAQEDSSPIELDWSCHRHQDEKIKETQKEEEDRAASLLHLLKEGGPRCRSVFSRGVLSPAPLSPSYLVKSNMRPSEKSFSALPGLTAPNCKLFPCWIFLKLFESFFSLFGILPFRLCEFFFLPFFFQTKGVVRMERIPTDTKSCLHNVDDISVKSLQF